MKNFVRLLLGVGLAGTLLYYFPVIDILMQLLYMLIPLAVLVGLVVSIAASFGLCYDFGIAQTVEAWVYNKQAAYAEWRESLAMEIQDAEAEAD